MSVRLSIIVPTCGRPTLARTLQSIAEQGAADTETLVIGDGPQPAAAALWAAAKLPGRYVETIRTNDWGGSQRNAGMALARQDYLLFQDDDDAFAPGAFAAVRAAAEEHRPGAPLLFRMLYARDGKVLWKSPEVTLGNVSTQMIAFPNRRSLLARWDSQHGHDYRFIRDTLALWPAGSVVWRQEVLSIIRPHERGDPSRSAPAAVPPCPHRSAAPVGLRQCGH